MKMTSRTSRDGGSDEEQFDNYCDEMTIDEIEKIVKEEYNLDLSPKETTSTETPLQTEVEIRASHVEAVQLAEQLMDILNKTKSETDVEDGVEVTGDAVVTNVRAKDVITQITDVGRIADRSLLLDGGLAKGAGSETVETVQSLVNQLHVKEEGRVVEVLHPSRKKGKSVLLIRFDNTKYRNAVLRSSKRLKGQEDTKLAKLRKPNFKDWKKMVNLVLTRQKQRRNLKGSKA